MALNIRPFTFDYQSGRVAPVQNITSPTWGPPDVSQMAMQGIAGILPAMSKAYQGVQQQLAKERGAAAAGSLDFGQQAAALGQPGGPYAATQPSGTAPSSAKLPSFAKIEGAAPSKEIGGLITATASTHGLAPDYLAKLVQIESGGDPNALNKGSKAAGLGQFIPSTWKQYGGGASPFDPGANLDATARFTLDNANTLRKALGREPTQGELYLAHQQGAGSAAKLLTNPDARAFDVVPPRNVLSNLPGAMRGQARDMTAGQFASLWTGRFGEPAPAFAAQGAPAPQQQQAAATALPIQAPGAGAPVMQLPPGAQPGPQPPNPSFASLGPQPTQAPQAPQATQAPQQQQPPEPVVQSGVPLFATAGPTMQLPPAAQAAPQAPQAPPAAPAAIPAPQAAAAAQAASPAVAAGPAPSAAPVAAPIAPPAAAPAAPPAAPATGGRSPQQLQQLRTILQSAILSGDPTLQAVAGQLMQQMQPEFRFLEAGGSIYRTDPRAGTAERVATAQAAPGFATLAPGDPRRPPGFANDPRTLQVDLRTGKIEPIEGPKNAEGGNNDQLLQPGDPARAALNIPDDNQTWRIRAGANGKREIEPIRNADVRESPAFTQEKGLRGEFDEKIKDYRALRQTYDNMISAVDNPDPQGDISMIFGFMKMLDPTSVVREGEYATAANSGGVSDSVRNTYNKILNGERLTPEQRVSFANRAGRILDTSHKQAKKDEARYRELATKGKLDPDNVAKLDDWKFTPRTAKKEEKPGGEQRVGAPGQSRANAIDITGMSEEEVNRLPAGTYIRQGGRTGQIAR